MCTASVYPTKISPAETFTTPVPRVNGRTWRQVAPASADAHTPSNIVSATMTRSSPATPRIQVWVEPAKITAGCACGSRTSRRTTPSMVATYAMSPTRANSPSHAELTLVVAQLRPASRLTKTAYGLRAIATTMSPAWLTIRCEYGWSGATRSRQVAPLSSERNTLPRYASAPCESYAAHKRVSTPGSATTAVTTPPPTGTRSRTRQVRPPSPVSK